MPESRTPETPAPVPQDELDIDADYDPAVDDIEAPASQQPNQSSAASPPTTAASASEPQSISHPARLIRQATELGITESEIRSTPTEVLDSVVEHMIRRERELYRDFQRNEYREQPRQQVPAVPPPASDDRLFQDEGGFHEELVGAIKKVDTRKELAEVKAELAAIKQREQVRETENRDALLDRVFDGFKDERLGRGPMRNLKGEPRDRRNAIYALAVASDQGSLEDRINAAYKLFYSEPKSAYGEPSADTPAETPTKNGLRQRREEWNRSGLARPTQREGGAELPKGDKKALETAKRRGLEMGLYNANDDEILSGIPD